MKRKKVYDFKNDVVFKYALANQNDPSSKFLLKILIEGILGIKCEEIQVLNPDLISKNYDDKEMILDVLVKTNEGTYVNVEMQNSKLTKMLTKRFDIYGCKGVTDQITQGKSYHEVEKVYQIIFIDDVNQYKDSLIDIFTMKDQKGRAETSNLVTRAYVYLPYINIDEKYHNLHQLSDVELAIYVFKNGFVNGIMDLGNEVVEIMKNKIDEFNEDDQLRTIAFKREVLRMEKEHEIEEATARGEARGKANAVLKLFRHSFPNADTSFLEGLTSGQYDLIFDMLLDGKDLNTILQGIH